MKRNTIASLFLGAMALVTVPVYAAFDSGSDGSMGDLVVSNDLELPLPPDGIFKFGSVTIKNTGRLKFITNALNTPVYLLATNDVVIEAGGHIDLSGDNYFGKLPGAGGPGGFAGGYGAMDGKPPGDGQGPGGGRFNPTRPNDWVGGVFAVPHLAGENTNVYGNALLVPLIGGSGGSGRADGIGGPGGGGAILIASNTRITVNGDGVRSEGAIFSYSQGYSGSAGAIRVVAPVVTGSGKLSAYTGYEDDGRALFGGVGRVRIDSLDRHSHVNIQTKGVTTRGSQLFVFPTNAPRLDILAAAGTAIAEGTPGEVLVTLPVGASTNQSVRVQARNFTGATPITVAVIPENGSSARFDDVIPAASGNNPSSKDVQVMLPVDVVTRIQVWSR